MTTLDATDGVPREPVHAGPEAPWQSPRAGTATESLVRRPYGRRPLAGDSTVWDG